ncbi:hypothetical protein E2C01_032691 [Portunus trituberculatus]|uniref:Uncharacterized protein n=1 Tax=Portunus trituberculatus TaxID=210409 RepID=A0A5B7F125_PORTR|nr:hypothetical protein [Portunus trituberculatus]
MRCQLIHGSVYEYLPIDNEHKRKVSGGPYMYICDKNQAADEPSGIKTVQIEKMPPTIMPMPSIQRRPQRSITTQHMR